MKTICSLILLSLSLGAIGQCDLKFIDDNDSIGAIYASSEPLKEYTSYYSISSIEASFSVYYHKEANHIVGVTLFLGLSTSGIDKLVIPRKIKVQFEDGTYWERTADSYSEDIKEMSDSSLEHLSMLTIHTCTYNLDPEDIETLKWKYIKSATLEDYKKGKKTKANPYNALFVEQLDCIREALVNRGVATW